MLHVLLACVSTSDGPRHDSGPNDPGRDDSVDSGTGTATLEGLAVEAAKVPTVLHVRGETDTPMALTVTATFGEGETVTRTEATAGTVHDLTLLGFPAETDVIVSASGLTPDGTAQAWSTSITTGALPDWVPTFDSDVPASELSEGGFLVAPVIQEMTGGVVILDDSGRVVWAWPQEATGLGHLPMRARMSIDGTQVLFNVNARDIADDGLLYRVSLDGETADHLAIPSGHTDFTEYTSGGYLMLGWEIRIFAGRQILGDTVIEVDPKKSVRTVWSAYDDFSPDLSVVWPNFYPADLTVEDWTHINGIFYDAARDEIDLSSTWESGFIALDRPTGDLAWYLTDFSGGSFDNVDWQAFATYPHSVQRVEGGVLVFSRGNPTETGECSEAVEIALDTDAWEARRTWSYEDPDCIQVTFLGEAQRLAGGNTLISWTTDGRLDEVTPDGTIVRSLSLASADTFGFTDQVPTLGE